MLPRIDDRSIANFILIMPDSIVSEISKFCAYGEAKIGSKKWHKRIEQKHENTPKIATNTEDIYVVGHRRNSQAIQSEEGRYIKL